MEAVGQDEKGKAMNDYTRKQKDAIRRAWNWLSEYASSHTTGGRIRLDRGLAYERSHRRDVIVAKALMVRGWLRGRTGDGHAEPSILDLWGISEGIMVAMIFGAHSRIYEGSRDDSEMIQVAADAVAAHNEHQTARLASI